MGNANLYFKFIDSATKAGKTGLSVTANVRSVSRAGGSVSTVASAASCVEVGDGVYAYNLSSPDFGTYDYVGTATPSSTSGLDNVDADAWLSDFSFDSLKPTTAGRTLDVSSTGEAGIDWANIGSPTTSVALSGTSISDIINNIAGSVLGNVNGSVASVSGNIGGSVLGSVLGTVAGIAGTTTTLDALQTALNSAHGAGSWATATGFSTHSAADVWAVGTRALTDKAGFTLSGTTTTLDALQTALSNAHGAGSWATATGFSTHSAADVWAVGTRALTDKAGFTLSGTTTTLDALQTALNNAHGAGSWATATGFSTASDIPSAATIATQVNTTLTNSHGTGSWQTGSGGGGGGSGLSGASSVTVNTVDANGDPIGQVELNVLGQGPIRTGSDGSATFGLNNGDYTITAALAGSGLLFPDTDITVTDLTDPITIVGTAPTLPIPAAPDQTTAQLVTRDGQGAIQGNVRIEFQLIRAAASDSYPLTSFYATSGEDGRLAVSLQKSTRYRARRGTGNWVEFATLTDDEFALPQILGA